MMRTKKTPRRKAPGGKAKEADAARCPLCELVGMFEHSSCECLDAFKQTRIEFLKAIRTLIDKRIDAIGKGSPKRGRGGRVRKIEVED